MIPTSREPGRLRLLLRDELDRGLDIRAQARLVELLRELMQRDGDVQIVCTTYSPYLPITSSLPMSACSRSTDSGGPLRDLSSSIPIRKMEIRDAVWSGELWVALGEDWVSRRDEPYLPTSHLLVDTDT